MMHLPWWFRRRLRAWLQLACVFMSGYTACALGGVAQWIWTPGARVSADYNDNRYLQLAAPQESTSIISTLDLAVQRQTENVNLTLRPRLTVVDYVGETLLDRNDQFADAQIEWLHERSQVAVGATHAREATATSELESTGFVATDKTRQSYSVSPSWSYQLGEDSSLQSAVNYSWVDYEDAQFTDLANYWSGSASLNYRIEANDTTAWSLGAYGSKMRSAEVVSETREYGLTVQIDRQWSQEVFWSLRVGSRHGRSQYRFFFREFEFQDDGWSMTASVNGQRHWGGWGANASRASQASGSGFVQLVDRVSTRASFAVSESLSLYAAALGAHFQELREGGAARDYARADVGAEWQIGESIRLRASYVRYAQQRKGATGRADANGVAITLEWREGIPTPGFNW